MEQQIMLAAKLYRCRNAAKALFGEEYKEKVSPYMGYIKAAMKIHNIDCEIKAAMKLIEDCKDIAGIDAASIYILAACIELIEPSN